MLSFRWLPCCLLLVFSSCTLAAKKVDLDYSVRLLPQSDQAEVSLRLAKGEMVRELELDLGAAGAYSDFKADGDWRLSGDHGLWKPSRGAATLSYRVRVSHRRESGAYDARMTTGWALLRGDDLVPAARLSQADGVELVSRLQFELPDGWNSVETGWPRIGKNRFRIDNPGRRFDRPTGWILAGKIGARRLRLGETEVTVAAPVGEGLRRMDIITLLTYVWPHAQAAFPRDPEKLLIVGAGEPMWRGGLSAPNSFFMQAERPLISENGTSPLLHELVHVFTRITDTDDSDWISEGVAEYYSIELLRRSGGLGEARYHKVREQLQRWSRDVGSLRGEHSSGVVTARAVLLLEDLNQEIRVASKGRQSLDDLVQGLMRLDKVSTEDVRAIAETLIGEPSKVLDTPLLADD